MKRILFYLILINFQSCKQPKINNGKIETYNQYRVQNLEQRDSLLISYTIKEWGKKDWYTFTDYSNMYNMTNEEIEYFFGGTFYSPDKKKLLVWIGQKKPNATTIEIYNKDKPEENKLCPYGKEIVYSMTALIGIRDSLNQTWNLYPFDQQQATCYDTKEEVINVLGQYYFVKMKTHKMSRMMQSGKQKGNLVSQPYGYNLQERDFWDKCWLWQKDTVCSYGLYPFQIKGYSCNKENYQDIIETYPDQKKNETNGQYIARQGRIVYKTLRETLKDCAEPYNPPIVQYPEEILRLYK